MLNGNFILYTIFCQTAMLRQFITILITIPRGIGKLGTWLVNPKNGSNYVTPFNRHYLSTGASLAVTVLYRTGAGLYNFFTSYVLGGLVYLFHVVTGVFLDLWRANPSYSRWALRNGASAIVIAATYTFLAAKVGGRATYSMLVIVVGSFR